MEKQEEIYDNHIEESIGSVSSIREIDLQDPSYSLKRRVTESALSLAAGAAGTVSFELERRTGLSRDSFFQYAMLTGVSASFLTSLLIASERVRERIKKSKYSPNESYLVESHSLRISKFGIIPKTDLDTFDLVQKVLSQESVPDEDYSYYTNILEEEKSSPYNIFSTDFPEKIEKYFSGKEEIPQNLIEMIHISRDLMDYGLNDTEFIKRIFLHMQENAYDSGTTNRDLMTQSKYIFDNIFLLQELGKKNSINWRVKSESDKSISFNENLEKILLLDVNEGYIFKKYINDFFDLKLNDYNLLEKIHTLSSEDMSEIKAYSFAVYLIFQRLMDIRSVDGQMNIDKFHQFCHQIMMNKGIVNSQNTNKGDYDYFLIQNIYDIVESYPDNSLKERVESQLLMLSEDDLLDQLNLYLSQLINFSPEYKYPLDKKNYIVSEGTLRKVLEIILLREFPIVEHKNTIKSRFIIRESIDNNKLKFALKVLKDYARFAKKEDPELFDKLKNEVIKYGIKNSRIKILKSEGFYLYFNFLLGTGVSTIVLIPIVIK